MKKIYLLIFIFVSGVYAQSEHFMKFTDKLLVDKTFYMVEDDGYETIVKFYLNDHKLKMFYMIDYKGKLDETNTLAPVISKNGFIQFTVFKRFTEFRLVKITDKEYIIKEYHNHSDKYKNILKWQFKKPKDFMSKTWNK